MVARGEREGRAGDDGKTAETIGSAQLYRIGNHIILEVKVIGGGQIEPGLQVLLYDGLQVHVDRPQRGNRARDVRRLKVRIDARHLYSEGAIVHPIADVVARQGRREREEPQHVLGSAAASWIAQMLVSFAIKL